MLGDRTESLFCNICKTIGRGEGLGVEDYSLVLGLLGQEFEMDEKNDRIQNDRL